MTGNVVPFGGHTRHDINPDGVLEGAKGKLNKVLVLGEGDDVGEWFAASTSNTGELLSLIERFKFKLLSGDFG